MAIILTEEWEAIAFLTILKNRNVLKELLDLKQLTKKAKDDLIVTLWKEFQKLRQKKPKKTSKNSSLSPVKCFKFLYMMYGHYLRMNQKGFCDFCEDRQFQRSIVCGNAKEFFSDCYFGIGVYWQAIDFLINQIVFSRTELQLMQKDIVFGGQPIDSDDIWFNFGPIRYFTKDQIKKIQGTLARISPEEIISSYSQSLFVEYEIHPDNWWVEDRADLVAQLKYYFLSLRAFIEDAIRCDQIIITFITAF